MRPNHRGDSSYDRSRERGSTTVLITGIIDIQVVDRRDLHRLDRDTDSLRITIRLKPEAEIEAGEVVVRSIQLVRTRADGREGPVIFPVQAIG